MRTDSKLLHIEGLQNMCIPQPGVRRQRTPTFGGVGISAPRRLYITNTHISIAKEQPALFGKDPVCVDIHGI